MNFFMNVSQIIFDLGGTGSVAKILKVRSSTISNWKKNNKIPNSYSDRILDLISEIKEKKLNSDFIIDNNIKDLSNTKLHKILIIIAGGVASYKSLELIRLFKKLSIETDVILTKSAQKFLNPLLITSLNGKKCFTELFSEEDEDNMSHIRLARNNDLILVAPTTANLMAKLANGLADDLASNVLLATENKVVLAPSMNPVMWSNPATQDNIKTLKERGVEFIAPDKGYMACGEEGIGRLPEINTISEFVLQKISKQKKFNQNLISNDNKLKNLKVLITAGPTQEKIDPIRYVSNNSSGKQGYAIAEEFKKKGAHVTLISGPTNISIPNVDKIIKIRTADEMLKETLGCLPADIFVGSAAVADWKLVPFDLNNIKINSTNKIKKINENNDEIVFKTKNNPDIIKTISCHKKRPKLVIGFAAETNNLHKNAKLKLISKKLDFIIANKINGENEVFGNDFNSISIVENNKIETHNKKNKIEIAKIIVNKILNQYL